MKIRILNVLLLLGLVNSPSNLHAEEWITEEVLQQLTEIRQEVKNLKSTINDLKQEIVYLKNVYPRQKNKIKSVEFGNAPRMGSEKSKIAIIEFSDFECPFCARHARNTFPKIKKEYINNEKIQYVSRNYPLSFHSKAKGAAVAVICAANQNENAYWSMYESLFSSGSKGLTVVNYKKLAEKNGLDLKQFTSCLNKPLVAQQIQKDIAYASKMGVTGTPAFFIGRISGDEIVEVTKLSGALPFNRFSKVIDSYLSE